MVSRTAPTANKKRKPRLLWANVFCLLDTSSGASTTVREMLRQLVKAGYEVEILGATVFDNPVGTKLFQDMAPRLTSQDKMVEVSDNELTHQLIVTKNTYRSNISAVDEDNWYRQYIYRLDTFKPDVVWFYGGQPLELLIADEARARSIPTAFYLANGNYLSPRWCRDIDLILCDSMATAKMYREKAGFVATPLGKFIDDKQFVAKQHERKRLLFVNPSFEKGASIVVQLALQLENDRPDIEIEVVEARAYWQQVLSTTTRKLGEERSSLSNVIVTPNTHDMRDPYSRARLLLAPSLWWESSGRVLAEAMLNSIPAIITNRGGMPEMIDDAGIKLDFPESCYEKPYQYLLSEKELAPLLEAVTAFYDDEALYQAYVERAKRVGREKHHISVSTERLTNALAPLVAQKAGNKDFRVPQRKQHKHSLAGTATKPTFSSEVYSQAAPGTAKQLIKASSASEPTPDFDWKLSSKVVVVDNRAKLIKTGAADKLSKTNAFTIIAFDPASEVQNPTAYEGHEYLQLFQHALLGDGQPTKLNACLDPSLSSPLVPLPEKALPEHHRQSAKVLTRLPINTIALDSIQGLPSLDWLILDDLSDASSILAHGEKALKDTLLIQARVAFQPTHEKQPNLAELQQWASRNGFRFYRLNDIQHHSHIPSSINVQERPATEQESADVLFLPSQERMMVLSDDQKLKLAFVLSSVFEVKDLAYELLNEVGGKQALEYLMATGIVTPSEKELKMEGNVNVDPLDPKDLEGVNLHIMVLEKFTAPFIDFMNKYIPESKTHYVITGDIMFAHGLRPQHGVEFVFSGEGFFRLEEYMQNAKKIIFHGLWSQKAYGILEKYPALYKKSYWFMWGGDFWYPKRHSKLKHKVIKNMGNLVTSTSGDVEYVRKKYNAKGKVFWASYPNNLVDLFRGSMKIEENEKNGPLKVLLGNSAFETNNHLEAMDKISSIKDSGISYQIICPLSYGPKEYAEKVIAKGSEIFGEKFKPLKSFIFPDEYKELLGTIDIAVFNHERQQAFNTTLILLSMGKKIFMNCRSTVYKKLFDEGFYLENIDDFHVSNEYDERLSLNASIAIREYSDSAIAKKMKDWIC